MARARRDETKNAPKALRKVPKQARAKVTVAAILDAAEQLLAENGFEGTTTNAVAERAGVSVGSLYQYFPNKDAIVVAIADRFAEGVLAMLDQHIAAAADRPLVDACHAFVHALVAVHAQRPRLHMALAAALPRIAGVDPLARYQARIVTRLRAYLHERRAELRVADLDTTVFILVHAVQAATHAAVLYAPEPLSDGRLAAALEDLVARALGLCESGGR